VALGRNFNFVMFRGIKSDVEDAIIVSHKITRQPKLPTSAGCQAAEHIAATGLAIDRPPILIVLW
jgi:hypothetical protein